MRKRMLLAVITGSPVAPSSAVIPHTSTLAYDHFTGLANDAALNSRAFPSGTGTWVAGSGAKGDGEDKVKFTSNTKNCKASISTDVTNAAMRVVLKDFGSTGPSCFLWVGDTVTSADPRFGHAVVFNGRDGQVVYYKVDAFIWTLVTDTTITFPATWSATGFNEYVLQRDGTRIDTWVNGTWMATFTTDGTFSTQYRWGVAIDGVYNAGQAGRIDEIEFYTVVDMS